MPKDLLPHLKKQPQTEAEWFEALIALARYLRGPQGCPWDKVQSSADFAGYLKGEAEELVEATKSADDAHLAEELGDTLFTLLATAAAAEAEGRLGVIDALQRAHEKMIRRHEHVFGDAKAETPEDAIRVWEEVKRREREAGQK
jgi:tetrapyrrole methylase family protein/MazG family protein